MPDEDTSGSGGDEDGATTDGDAEDVADASD